jgi:sigma-B regulation protein RsbU (phosphoserine phosphatase)
MNTGLSDIHFDIIIAEDEPITQKRLTGMVSGLGHPVRSCANGREAWESFDASPARVIISDWQMPEMDGADFCRKVRAREKTEYTYFILVTGEHTSEADYEDAISAGADDFLIKPLSRDSIWRRLRVARRILGFTKHIRQLELLIPICAYCKQIREDDVYRSSLEEYVHTHTGSHFTHGICPGCYDQMIGELDAIPVCGTDGSAAEVHTAD